MVRALRISFPGAWYHITARGNERRPIFWDDDDRLAFLQLLADVVDRFRWFLYAFVLMENHYHLEVETQEANLSRALQSLNGGFSSDFNRRHHRSGHLFHGRFHAVLLEPTAAALEVSRYLHLNPIRTQQFGLGKANPPFGQWGGDLKPSPNSLRAALEALHAYRWSSYRAFIGEEQPPAWLSSGVFLNRVGLTPAAYRSYVEAPLQGGRLESPWTNLQAQLVLGSPVFVDRIRGLADGNRREQPSLRLLTPAPSWEQIVGVVEALRHESWIQFWDRHGDWGRDLVLCLARHHKSMTLAELGHRAGGIDYVSVASALQRFHRRCQQDPPLARLLQRAHQQLQNAKM